MTLLTLVEDDMKIKLSTAGLVIGALLLPAAGYTADQPSKTTTEKVKENVSDATITAKIKTEFAKDKQVDAMHLNVDTDNKGVVTLRGMAKSQAEADKAVAIAKATQGVTAVKNEMQIASETSTDGSMAKKSTTASTGKSDQPIDDTAITTRVKARMVTDKLVDAGNIHVTTVNGVVELSGTAKNKAEADKAVAIARKVPDVKSVKNGIHVTSATSSGDKMSQSGGSMSKSGGSMANHSDQPIDDTMITTSVKARMATAKDVSATNISVKTVNGVVELSGTAKSKAEADQAVAIARGVDHVKSVKNEIQVK
jgi:hyperosmotically inducible periplasmic protein